MSQALTVHRWRAALSQAARRMLLARWRSTARWLLMLLLVAAGHTARAGNLSADPWRLGQRGSGDPVGRHQGTEGSCGSLSAAQ
ncbi:MAG: hypothetical protein WA747_11140 [Steroidobacteraceae bacterium]